MLQLLEQVAAWHQLACHVMPPLVLTSIKTGRYGRVIDDS